MLTDVQKEVILSAKKENDYCIIANRKTMNALDRKGYAEFTSGFGHPFGAIMQLTEKGRRFLNENSVPQGN